MPATALEQMILELINRARLDPAAEAARDGIDLNEGLPAGTISAASKQPLAMNETLLSIARAHDQDMLANNYFDHVDSTGKSPFDRMTAAGYAFSTAGENIAWNGTTGTLTQQMSIDLETQLFVDAGVAGRGHRTNLLNGAFQEIGAGLENGAFMGFNATLLTEDFAAPAVSTQFLTGVSYVDLDHNNFYSIGEGRNGVSVSVVGAGSTATAGAGGYSLAIGAGVQTVTFSGGGLSAPVSVAVTIAAGVNAKVDMVDQGVVTTSTSLTDLGGASRIIGLGTIGLTLTGDASAETFSGTPGDDTINGGGGIDSMIYSAARSAYTITNLGGGVVRVSGPDGTDTLTSIERLIFSDQTVALSKPANYDFNGDGTSDILWRGTGGDVGYWALTNNVATWRDFGPSSTAYNIVATGDFDGDGTTDILWRNAATGDTGSWTTANNTATWHDYGISSTDYSVVGAGDLNADGVAEVVWRDNSTGDTGYWAITNSGANASWHDYGVTNTAYSIVGVGDFNGDGAADLLWRNASTGDTGFWAISNNGATTIWHDLGTSSTAYSVVGVGDLTGDGIADILWRNNSTGDTGFWAVANNAASWHDYGPTDTSYSVVGVHDYNGDGVADILWRCASDGDTGYWAISNNGATANWHDFGVTSTAYSVQNV